MEFKGKIRAMGGVLQFSKGWRTDQIIPGSWQAAAAPERFRFSNLKFLLDDFLVSANRSKAAPALNPNEANENKETRSGTPYAFAKPGFVLYKNRGLQVSYGKGGHRARIAFDARGDRSNRFANQGVQTRSDGPLIHLGSKWRL
jgi:hypothetical protein